MDSEYDVNKRNGPAGPILVVLAFLFAATGVGLTAWRTWENLAPLTREYSFDKMGMVDFKNGGYLPSLAFREGVNPYSEEICQLYPKDRPTPPLLSCRFCDSFAVYCVDV